MIENTINIQELRKQITEDVCNGLRDMLQSQQGYMPMNLDNCTDASQSAPEGGNPMAYERIRVFMGLDNHGKPIYTQISGKTQDERNDKVIEAYIQSGRIWEFIPKQPTSIYTPTIVKSTPGYCEIADRWIAFSEGRRDESSKSPYKSNMRFSKNFFGDKPIGDIRVHDIQEFLNTLINPRTEDFYAKKYITNIKNMVEQVFDYAIAEEYISSNPSRSNMLYNPSDKKDVRIALGIEELNEVIQAIPSLKTENERLYMIMLTSLPYRRGEALGQRWEDIDFKQRTAKVTGTVAVIDSKAKYRKKAKNDQSLRTMIAPDYFLEALKPYRKTEGFVINTAGEHLTANEITKIWDSIKQQIPLVEEKGLTPYNFRHTNATIFYHETGDMISLKAQMGHSPGSTIAEKSYIHDDLESRRKSVQKMEKGISKSA